MNKEIVETIFAKGQIPKKYYWLAVVWLLGFKALVLAIYIIDWLWKQGERAELLLILDKL